MMVKQEVPNESVPAAWQDIIPNQMPWMLPYEQASLDSFRFGLTTNPVSNPNQDILGIDRSSLTTITTTTPEGLSSLQNNNNNNTYSLTHLPSPVKPQATCDDAHKAHPSHKRTLVEMDLDNPLQEPPSKQLLSEQRLFKKFGSLHLQGDKTSSDTQEEDVELEDLSASVSCCQEEQSVGNKMESIDLNQYVYILYKDRKSESLRAPSNIGHCNTTLDRLAREERDKLNKAVVLWNPSGLLIRANNFVDSQDSSEEDEAAVAAGL